MFEGKENYLDLIQELRTVNALQSEEQELQKAEKDHVLTLMTQRDISRHKVKHTQAHIHALTFTKHKTVS